MKILTVLLLPLLLAAPMAALETPPDPCVPAEGESLFSIVNVALNNLKQIEDEATEEAEVAADKAKNATVEAQKEITQGATTPEAFGDRIYDSLADFLPLAQFAVSSLSTSDDKKSLIAKFKTFPLFGGVTALNVSAAEPEAFSKLLDTLPESLRESAKRELVKDAGDFSDLTASFDWGYRRTAKTWYTTPKLFGRDARIYQSLADELGDAALQSIAGYVAETLKDPTEELFKASRPAGELFGLDDPDDILNEPYSQFVKQVEDEADPGRRAKLGAALEQVRQMVCNLAEKEVTAHQTLPDFEALASMIANQPDLVVKINRHERDEAIGPIETLATISYEQGTYNLNRVRRIYRQLMNQDPNHPPEDSSEGRSHLLEAYRQVAEEQTAVMGAEKENRMVYSLTYKDVEDYNPKDLSFKTKLDDDTTVTTHPMLDLPGGREYTLRVQYSKPLSSLFRSANLSDRDAIDPTGADVRSRTSRLDLSIEGCWFDDSKSVPDELERTKNRFIVKATFTQPLGNGMSVPFSIVYANRSEFLKGEQNQLSAHVAFSYKMLSANVVKVK